VQNKTNGVTPRRWINQANPGLASVITKWLDSEEWLKHLDMLVRVQGTNLILELHSYINPSLAFMYEILHVFSFLVQQGLRPVADHPGLHKEWQAVKQACKVNNAIG
jgi:hypothetical protein